VWHREKPAYLKEHLLHKPGTVEDVQTILVGFCGLQVAEDVKLATFVASLALTEQ
jgi:hypothetical protein